MLNFIMSKITSINEYIKSKNKDTHFIDEDDDNEDENDFNSGINLVDTVLDEINYSNQNNLVNNIEQDKLYLIRIWIGYCNQYVYKLGTTKNLKQRIISINNNYNCCGKIILIFCVEINNTTIEQKFHKSLSPFKNNNIINPLKCKPREMYNITSIFYDKLKDEIEKLSNNFFESEYYVLDNNNIEHYRLERHGIKNIKCPIDINGHIILDQHKTERLFWIYQKDI